MGTVGEIERAIQQLSREDLLALRQWFLAFDAEVWDRDVESDALSGRLDALADEAVAEARQGRAREL